MKKIYLLIFLLTLSLTGFAQVKPGIESLKSDRTQPLQAEDISPMNVTTLHPGVPPADMRFPVGAERNFRPLFPLQTTPNTYNGLTFVRTPDSGLPYFIKGTPDNLDKSASLTEQRRQYLQIVADEMRCNNPAQEFIEKSTDTDRLGITHTRFEQYYNGVKVYGSEIILHAKNGSVNLLNGRFFPTPALTDVTPAVSEAAAVQTVKTAVAAEAEAMQITPGFEFLLPAATVTTELVIYHPEGRIDNPRLTYHITYIPDLANRWEYFTDAETGEILHAYNNVCRFHNPVKDAEKTSCNHHHTAKPTPTKQTETAAVMGAETAVAQDLLGASRLINVYETGGTYFMIDAARDEMFNAAQSNIPNEPVGVVWTIDANNNNVEGNSFDVSHVVDSDNNWNNPTGVSAHFNGGSAYEYFQDVHNRTSINGAGGNIVSIINVEDSGGPMDNAFWNGSAIFYGNGTSAFKPLARGLDVAGHEMSHGVIQATANMDYEFESGALNESFADIFGAMIDRDDWQIGEDVVEVSTFPSGALRDMADPNQGGSDLSFPGWQPAHTNEQYLGNQDNGGVHINSGIPNKAYQLFATAIGKDKAEEIFYYALTNYLVRSSQFIDCRASVEQAAADLYGTAEVQAAQNAFNAVGIGTGGGTGGGANGGNSQDDFEANPGQDYIVFQNINQTELRLYRPDGTETADPFTTVAPISKPSVTDDGTAVVYVSEDKRLQLIIIDWAEGFYEQSVLNDDPIWRNIAVARDGTRVAALTDDFDDRVYIYDFTLEVGEFYTLYNPTYTQGVETGDVNYADVLEWDFTGNWVLYDAFNSIPGNFGDDIEYWDIGFVNVFNHDALQFGSGEVEKLFTGLPENVSIGNPTFAKNSDYIIAFDYIDEFSGDYELRAANIQTGDVGTVFSNFKLSYPNYSPSDENMVFNAGTQSGTDVLAFVPLADNKIEAGGDAFVFIEDGQQAVWFAEGFRDFTDVNNLPITEKGINVSPNPFNGILQVELELTAAAKLDFILTDITGRTVKQQTQNRSAGHQVYSLSFGDIPAGAYFLQIISESGNSVIKVVKQ